MSASRSSHQFEGVILSNRPGAGSDSYVDIFSPEFGMVGVVAKGGRASKKRFAGGLDIGTFGEFVAEDSGKLLWRLDSMTVLFQPLALRGDLDWLAALTLMVESVHVTTAAGQPEPQLYHKLRDAIVFLDSGAIEKASTIWRDILVHGGLMTGNSTCESCESGAQSHASFAPPKLVCSACALPRMVELPLLWHRSEDSKPRLSDQALREAFLSLERFFAKWFERTSGTQLKSARLLSKLGE